MLIKMGINFIKCFASFWYQAERSGNGAVRNKEMGKLIYQLATTMKSQIRSHSSLLARYIAERKITSEVQLSGKL